MRRNPKSLAARSIDLAVDVPHPVPETLRHAPLFSDDFCVVSRAGHGFAATPTFAAYAAADHIAVSTRHDGAVIEDVSLLALGISRRVRLRCQSYGTAMTVAEGSDLLATIPRRIAARLQPGRALVLTDPPAALSPVKLHLYWHADQHTDPASQWLRGLLRP